MLGFNSKQNTEFLKNVGDAIRRHTSNEPIFTPWDSTLDNKVKLGIQVMVESNNQTKSQILETIRKAQGVESTSGTSITTGESEVAPTPKSNAEGAFKEALKAVSSISEGEDILDREAREKFLAQYRDLLLEYIQKDSEFSILSIKVALARLKTEAPHPDMRETTDLVFDVIKDHKPYLETLSPEELKDFLLINIDLE